MVNDAPVTHGYSLLLNDVVRQRLRVLRGRSAPLLHTHLPIQMRAQKGQVCRVEVEEHQPLLSMVGHLEPKKFDCSFAEGDVVYVHSGNPLTNHDHVQVTIFFFRNNNSVVQTVDIMVDIEQPLPSWSTDEEGGWTRRERENQTEQGMHELNRAEKTSPHAVDDRVMILGQINVASLKSTSVSISPEVLRINYDPEHEECRLSYTSPDFGSKITNNMDESVEVETGSISGTYAPKLGLPLAAGAAVGGVQRWPLFGQLVAFNRSTVYFFDHDCQEALLQGYRYMHRKVNSPQTDYIPMQVTIWSRSDNGLRHSVLREGIFIKVSIINGQILKQPVVRTFRQVNVTHIGGSLSVLPRDSISVPHDAVPGLEYLDVNMTKMQGPLQAQIVNLRDPTRPVTSFRLLDLRRGLIALQLLNYAESLVKVGCVSFGFGSAVLKSFHAGR
ncbi:hypothetical protein P879_02993 [Paragonimus westermani]|uniref:FRAS1-related extracellular matrix protein N-terminal domain-containing protein n=1 Tax=Paragonimus westermani TaxID=34504 RepID=A0A8T0DJ61_9TREM|nr:hypothetical protein P879_02993 [Paragonimus westermani]